MADVTTLQADFTFVCPSEIVAFSDRIEEFREIDAEVVSLFHVHVTKCAHRPRC